MRSMVRVQSITPRPQLNNFSRATVPLKLSEKLKCSRLSEGEVHQVGRLLVYRICCFVRRTDVLAEVLDEQGWGELIDDGISSPQ